jgi:hypothetical protein
MSDLRPSHLHDAASSLAFKLFGAAVVILILSQVRCNERPDTTDRMTPEDTTASGMHLRIDARTGCHYLEVTDGGITPRLDSDGRHICDGYSSDPFHSK